MSDTSIHSRDYAGVRALTPQLLALVVGPAFSLAQQSLSLPTAPEAWYIVGEGLAYLSLAFGILFFAFAARYYLGIIAVLVSPTVTATNGKNGTNGGNGANHWPMVSVHIALYNEEHVVDRILTACSKLTYPKYEVVVVDDSTDGTVTVLKKWLEKQLESESPKIKIFHRENRQGFKGGALNEALRNTDPRAEYVAVFDADFVPPPDTLNKFLDYFNRHAPNGNGNGNGRYGNGKLAAVQGYQWHTLNRTENWLTRGVSCEFSGSYMVDRAFQEVMGTLKMIAGSVYMIKAGLLRQYGWSTSLTEDWELTLRLYKDGHRILYTPLIQAPGECPSNLGKLIRQRMRWAEGHTFNVKKYFLKVMLSPKVNVREKLEFLYFTPYYLQSAFLILGTLFWLTSDVILAAKLPFWTATVGWGLVFTNLLALPVMSLTGLFLEKRTRADFSGILSQVLLIYALSPYQAYAALKGLVEPVEGSWVRTFKSGKIEGFPGKLTPRRVIKKLLPPKRSVAKPIPARSTRNATIVLVLGLSVLGGAFAQGQLSAQSAQPAYYFYDQAAPTAFHPFTSTPPGASFLMHLPPPSGSDARVSIGQNQSSGPIFFSDAAPSDLNLPFGASVSIHIWVDANQPQSKSGGTLGNLKFRIDIYDPQSNSIRHIEGAGETEVFHLQLGVNSYQASCGNIAQNKVISKDQTLMATIWCPDCKTPPTLLFNSAAHPSNIDFPIEVPENSISLVGFAFLAPTVAGLVLYRRRVNGRPSTTQDEDGGIRRIQRTLIVAAAVLFFTFPLVMTFNEFLTSIVASTGLDKYVSSIVPYEAGAVSSLLRGFGVQAGNSANSVWVSGSFIPMTAFIGWNCAGWQSFVILGITSFSGLSQIPRHRKKLLVLVVGVLGVFAVNVLRILLVVLLGYFSGYPAALIFHNYGGTIMTLAWLLAFWTFVLRRYGREED